MKHLRTALLFLATVIASGAYIQLFKDGGARLEGGDNLYIYKGGLNYIPYIFVGLSFTLFFTRYKISAIIKCKSLTIYLGLCVFAIASALLSDYSFSSISTAIQLASILFAVILSTSNRVDIISALKTPFLLISASSVLAAILTPSYGISIGVHDGSWQGVFTHKNSLGAFSAISGIAAAIAFLESRSLVWLFTFALNVCCIYFSNSTTSQIGFAVGLVLITVMPALERLVLSRRKAIIFTFVVLTGFLVIPAAHMAGDFEILGKEAGLSKRDSIWIYLLDQIQSRAMIGHGLSHLSSSNFNNDNSFAMYVGFNVLSAHNGFIDLLYSLGFAGAMLFLSLIYTTFGKAQSNRMSKFYFPIVVVSTVLASAESLLVGVNMFMLLLAGAIAESFHSRGRIGHETQFQ